MTAAAKTVHQSPCTAVKTLLALLGVFIFMAGIALAQANQAVGMANENKTSIEVMKNDIRYTRDTVKEIKRLIERIHDGS